MDQALAIRGARVRVENLDSNPHPKMPMKNRGIGQWGKIVERYPGLDSDAVKIQLFDELEDPIGDGIAVYYLSELEPY